MSQKNEMKIPKSRDRINAAGQSRALKTRTLALGLGAAILALGAGAPALAGGGHFSFGYASGYHGGHYGGGYYKAGYRHGYRGHHRRHHRRHHRGGGGKGAAIALGVIGGAIILNELAEDRAEDRYYRDRYYEDRYYRERAYRDRYERDRYGYDDGDEYDDRYAERSDDAPYDDDLDGAAPSADNELERRLEGGHKRTNPPDRRAPSIRISSEAAYQTCLDHARRALGERGFVVSAPYRPDTADAVGDALLMTATVTAQRGGESWSRAMSCEASNTRVYRMELI